MALYKTLKVAKDFPDFLMKFEPFASLEDGQKYDCDAIQSGIRQAFLDFDLEMKKVPDISTSGW